MRLPSPADLGRSVEVAQMVTARKDGDSFVFEGRLSARPGNLLIASSDMMGRRAMTIRWTGQEMEFERAEWLPPGLKPENVLADIMIMYWPRDIVARALGPDVRIEEAAGERRVLRNGELIITVRHEGTPMAGTAILTNHVWSYQIEVRSTVLSS